MDNQHPFCCYCCCCCCRCLSVQVRTPNTEEEQHRDVIKDEKSNRERGHFYATSTSFLWSVQDTQHRKDANDQTPNSERSHPWTTSTYFLSSVQERTLTQKNNTMLSKTKEHTAEQHQNIIKDEKRRKKSSPDNQHLFTFLWSSVQDRIQHKRTTMPRRHQR